MLDLLVTPAEAGNRLDRFLAAAVEHLSRSRIQALIRDGHVLVNQRSAKPSEALRSQDVVSWEEPAPVSLELAPEAMALSILFEDERLLVLNKPAGLVIHPAPGNEAGTLVNALLAHCPTLSGIGGVRRPGIVHRLDKETSGCLVVAKDDVAHRSLSAQFAARETHKIYLAVVIGRPREASGLIDAPIGRHPVQRKKMAIVPAPRGRTAQTRYRVVRELEPPLTLIECQLLTGRTHQIRVHLKSLGCPVAGDPVYGRGRVAFERHLLHAWKLGFSHPCTGERLDFIAPPPGDFPRLS